MPVSESKRLSLQRSRLDFDYLLLTVVGKGDEERIIAGEMPLIDSSSKATDQE
jgi:hypothetical protein